MDFSKKGSPQDEEQKALDLAQNICTMCYNFFLGLIECPGALNPFSPSLVKRSPAFGGADPQDSGFLQKADQGMG
jgi:hypothetical protein